MQQNGGAGAADRDGPPLLTGGRRRRAFPWRATLAVALLLVAIGVPLALAGELGDGTGNGSGPVQTGAATPKPLLDRAAGGKRALREEEGSERFAVDLSEPDLLQVDFGRAPRAGLLFDVRTGRVLWRLEPERRLAIASLTKMMTALLVVEHDAHERVRITRRAARTPGSAVGVLPKGKRVQLEALLNGLLLVSGNDAAVALAQHVSGTVPAFVAAMNRRAGEMGLACTRFTTPHGLEDQGNHSCAADLAALARADLHHRRIRRIARRDEAILKFPIKGGRLFLYNHNPLVRRHYRGVTGLKTGYTDRAGRTIVATARHGSKELGVVLLHSYDAGAQAERLLDRGFKALRGESR